MQILKKILRSPGFSGTMFFYIAKILYVTLRVKVVRDDHYDISKQYLFASWHGRKFLAMKQLLLHKTPKCALVSPSRDGAIITKWLEKMGYTIERGSSREDSLRGLLGMVRRLKEGFSLCFIVDGPIGPIYKVKPGITYVSQKYQLPIVPLGTAFSRKWVFHKSWDRYQIPKPFTRAIYFIGEPIVVPKDADLEEYNVLLEQRLNEANSKAEALLM